MEALENREGSFLDGASVNYSASTTVSPGDDSILYECDSGEYILQVYQCDGKEDCNDGSDEIGECGLTRDSTSEII